MIKRNSPEEKSLLVKKYFKVFMEEVMGFDNAPFQDEIDDIISNDFYKKICIAIARGHGKSTHLSVGYPLWELALNHELRFLIVSSTSTVASSFITQIINHIEGNENYRYWSKFVDPSGRGVIPKMRRYQKKEEKWSGGAITIERHGLNSKDPSVAAIGLFGGILSKRADRIIGDDIVNQKNSETQEQREKTKEWVYTTLLPILMPKTGRFIYLGNTWHVDDLISNFLKDPQFDYASKLPAVLSEPVKEEMWQEFAKIRLDESISPEERHEKARIYYISHKDEMNEGLKLLWPEMFDYQQLYLEKLSNPFAYARMRMCDPASRPDQRIKEEWIQNSILKGKIFKLQDSPRENLEMRLTACGLDLAVKEDETGDDTVHLSLDLVKYSSISGINPGDYIIRNIECGKFSPNKTREIVKEKDALVKPIGTRVESNGYQRAMARDLEDVGLPITSYHTGGEKMNSEIGVNSLAILLENGRLILPYDNSDPRTIEIVSKLLNQMRDWPTGHTGDILMALWFAFSEIRDAVASAPKIPTPMGKTETLIKEEVDVFNKEIRKELEKEADKKVSAEQLHQRRLLTSSSRMWTKGRM